MPVQGGTDDGSWPFYDRHRRLLIVQSYMGAKRAFRPVGHPSKIHFSCSKDNLNVAGKPPLPSLSLSSLYYLAHSLNS